MHANDENSEDVTRHIFFAKLCLDFFHIPLFLHIARHIESLLASLADWSPVPSLQSPETWRRILRITQSERRRIQLCHLGDKGCVTDDKYLACTLLRPSHHCWQI